MNFDIFGTVFSAGRHTLNRPSNISKDSRVFQLHADALLVFITFAFRKLCALAR